MVGVLLAKDDWLVTFCGRCVDSAMAPEKKADVLRVPNLLSLFICVVCNLFCT